MAFSGDQSFLESKIDMAEGIDNTIWMSWNISNLSTRKGQLQPISENEDS